MPGETWYFALTREGGYYHIVAASTSQAEVLRALHSFSGPTAVADTRRARRSRYQRARDRAVAPPGRGRRRPPLIVGVDRLDQRTGIPQAERMLSLAVGVYR